MKSREEKKFNCRRCKYKKEWKYSFEVGCEHPGKAKILNSPDSQATGGNFMSTEKPAFTVELNPHAVIRGWIDYPKRYDPDWIVSCDGYEEVPYDKI